MPGELGVVGLVTARDRGPGRCAGDRVEMRRDEEVGAPLERAVEQRPLVDDGNPGGQRLAGPLVGLGQGGERGGGPLDRHDPVRAKTPAQMLQPASFVRLAVPHGSGVRGGQAHPVDPARPVLRRLPGHQPGGERVRKPDAMPTLDDVDKITGGNHPAVLEPVHDTIPIWAIPFPSGPSRSVPCQSSPDPGSRSGPTRPGVPRRTEGGR